MANMNITPERETYASPMATEYNNAPCIYLTDDQVEALGIKEPPKPGTKFQLKCVAVATSVTSEMEEQDEVATEGNKPDVRMTLRLDDIEVVGKGGTSHEQAATVLYGGGE